MHKEISHASIHSGYGRFGRRFAFPTRHSRPASSAPINLKSFGRISGSIILVGGNGPAFSGGGGHIGGMSGPRGGGGNFVTRGGGGNFVTQRPRQ
jgi:hypothetical protein